MSGPTPRYNRVTRNGSRMMSLCDNSGYTCQETKSPRGCSLFSNQELLSTATSLLAARSSNVSLYDTDLSKPNITGRIEVFLLAYMFIPFK